MSFLKNSQTQSSVYICHFECFISQVNIEMKFPCTYFAQWRTINSKYIVKTQKHQPQNNKVIFNERIKLSLQMIFDGVKQEFSHRQTIVQLFLVSKSRPDQVRMVGRVNIDVSKVINVGMYSQSTIFQLCFSSVQASMIMQFKTLEQVLTSMSIHNLDRSSFAEYIARSEFKSHNKYQSIVLAKCQNKSQEKSSLEKTHLSDVRLSSKNVPKQRNVSKISFLNDSTFLNKESQISQTVKRLSPPKQENIDKNSFLNQSRILQQINHSFSKNNNDNWIIKDEAENLKLAKQVMQLKLQISRLEIQLKTLKEDNNYKNIEISQLKETIQKHKLQISSKMESIQLLQTETNNLRTQIRQLKNINLKHSRLNQQLSSQMRCLTQQIMKNKQNINCLTTELKQVVEYNNQLKKQAHNLQKLNLELKQKISMVKTQEFQMQKLRDQLKCELIKNQKLNHFKNRGDSLQLQNMLLAERLREFQRNGQEYQKKFSELQQLVVSLQQVNQKCNERVRQSQQIELQMRAKIEQLQIENNNLMTSLQNQRDQFEKSNEGLKIQIQMIKSEIQAYSDEVNMLKIQLQNARESINYQKKQQLRIQLQQKCNRLEENINSLQIELQEQINRNNELNQTIVQLTQREIFLRNNLQILEQQSQHIYDAYRQRQQNQKKLKQIIESLKKKVKEQQFNHPSIRNNMACQQKPSNYTQQRNELLRKKKQILQNSRSLLMSNSQAQLHQRQLKKHIQNIILKRNKSRQALQNHLKQLGMEYKSNKRPQELQTQQSTNSLLTAQQQPNQQLS